MQDWVFEKLIAMTVVSEIFIPDNFVLRKPQVLLLVVLEAVPSKGISSQ